MSTSNPLQPQAALDNAPAPKSRVRITVLTILGLHVVFIGGLLLQGCDKGNKTAGGADPSTNSVSALPPLTDTNYFSSFPGDGLAGSNSAAGAAPATSTYAPTSNSTAAFPSTSPLPGSSLDSGLTGAGVAGGTAPSLGSLPPPVTSAGTGATTSGNEHIVKKGDIIRDIAKHYGVTEKAILDANPNVKPRNMKVGDKLVIPAPAPAAVAHTAPDTGAPAGGSTAAVATSGESYVVKAGDNLTKIAKQFGVTVKQLRAANNIKSDRLVPKQRLVIPAKASPSSAPSNATAPATNPASNI
ncbi:MAG: LysM peptidoglycan-binding domain-containing protein [Verrucomicrobiales bacterium]|nr:LysM peptidoglycan-binding domain-containing protein [Verrucomicrobiales bacterium]